MKHFVGDVWTPGILSEDPWCQATPTISSTKFGTLVKGVIALSLQDDFFLVEIKMNGLSISRYLWIGMALKLVS